MKTSAPSVPPRALVAAALLTLSLGAQSLTGRIVDPGGLPIPGVTIEPNHGAPSGVSDPAGYFTIAGLQNITYDVEYRPTQGAPWVGRLGSVTVSGATNIGDVVLQPGFTVTGVVRGPGGLALPGCNINVYDGSGTKLFTPHDGTDLTGMFLVTVPAGTWDVRIVPPIGTLLVPRQFRDLLVAAAVDLGNITVQTGYQVTGSVIDSSSNVPVGATRIRAGNALDGEPIVLLNDTANAFGAFTVLLPFGVADLRFDPPPGNTHVGRRIFGAFVLGPTALGQVRLQNGVMVTGTVTGPGGAIAGADIDVFAADGSKVYTPHDLTSATGAFGVAVPPGDTYTVRVEPPVTAGLVGHRSQPTAVSTATNLGAIPLLAGVQVTGTITGPLGPESDADLDFLDSNGVEVVTVGDHTDASGQFTTYVPAGTWSIEIDSAEGSHGRPVSVPGVAIAGPTTWNRTLPSKDLVTELTSFGIPTLLQGGLLPLNPFVRGLAAGPVPTNLELAVVLPSGQELPLYPAIPLNVVPFPLQLVGVWVQVPTVPSTALGKELELVMRFRDPVTNAVQDEADTPFVVQ